MSARPSSSSTTISARKSAFLRRQVRLLGHPLRPSPAWTEHNAAAESAVGNSNVADSSGRRRRGQAGSGSRQTQAQTQRRTRRRVGQNGASATGRVREDDEGGEEESNAGDDSEGDSQGGENGDGRDRTVRSVPGGIPGDIVASVLRQVNLKLKKHITHSYPSVAIRHVAEQIDKLYWNAGAPVDEDAQIKALEFRERMRREEVIIRNQSQSRKKVGGGADDSAGGDEDDWFDTGVGFEDYPGEGEDVDMDGIVDGQPGHSSRRQRPFAPDDPRSGGLMGTHILPRVGDDFTLTRPFQTLPPEWDPALDIDTDAQSDRNDGNTAALASEYAALYARLRNLHDRRVHLRLRAKAYSELGKLVEPLVGEVGKIEGGGGDGVGTDSSIDGGKEDGEKNVALDIVQPNLVTRDSDLQEQLRVCRALSLQLRVRLAN